MKYSILKNKRNRILYSVFEKKRNIFRAIIQNLNLSLHFRTLVYFSLINMPKNSSITRIKNRCIFTNRPRAIYKKFGISRLMFRKFAWQGILLGVKKASW